MKIGPIMRRWTDGVRGVYLRLAASGVAPALFSLPKRPDRTCLRLPDGALTLEIVTHCWRYSHLLAYQLSSLVLHPPTRLTARVTVFHSEEDHRTIELLDFFSRFEVPGVSWNWQRLERSRLMRRAIGRNQAALATTADWVWFTDCDVVFHEGCLDALADQLRGRRSALVFPQEERCTSLLVESDPMLTLARQGHGLLEIDPSRFAVVYRRSRATGPLQIAHGDVARSHGYCDCLNYYQAPRDRWCKCHEDRAFRWLLGTQGEAIEVPGVYRIRHSVKGRDRTAEGSRIRRNYRRAKSWLRDHLNGRRTAA
jgi:hypothetical protein